MTIRIGTAGWSIPKASAARFGGSGSHLERYANVFNAVEINSSFYRPHRPATYARWAASVPSGFRFAVKLPRAMTHERRLVDCGDLIARFSGEVIRLGSKLGAILIQLPPSLAFDIERAAAFFDELRVGIDAPFVCEPRHTSWFTSVAEKLLIEKCIARVAADPPPVSGASEPGGWHGIAYRRLHGSPRIYWSNYDDAAIAAHAEVARASPVDSWIIYDNTAAGAAIENASSLLDRLI